MLREHGAPEEEIAKASEQAIFPLWPSNLRALRLFAACSTQWRWTSGPDGKRRRVGLDYAGVEATARLAGIRWRPRIFPDLQLCESEALAIEAEAA